jgi:hypothetical protein
VPIKIIIGPNTGVNSIKLPYLALVFIPCQIAGFEAAEKALGCAGMEKASDFG